MKQSLFSLSLLLIIGTALVGCTQQPSSQSETSMPSEDAASERSEQAVHDEAVEISATAHATMALTVGDQVLYIDPTGGVEQFDEVAEADIVLVTDIHSDHFDQETIELVLSDAELIVPQAVFDDLPQHLKEKARVLNNTETVMVADVAIEAIPMYNLPESDDAPHVKGRGNGYLITGANKHIYIAGDTAGIPEMRALDDIDIAFIPMNMPYTMSVEEAADAVLEFAPRVVYPYHYRGQNGLADIETFKTLVNEGNDAIEVRFLDWY